MERTGLRHETLTVTMELLVPTDTPFSSPNRDWGLRRRMETVWVFPVKGPPETEVYTGPARRPHEQRT